MATDRQIDDARRDARALLRAVRAGDTGALARATELLGERLERRFVYADALHVVARELGRGSWPALVAERRRGAIRVALDAVLAEDGADAIEVDTGLEFPDGSPVLVSVRRREHRYMLDDGGAAVAKAGRRTGWLESAERRVLRSGMNVSRTTGAVFVPAVEGRDLESLSTRLAEAALEVYVAIVELDDPR